MLHTGTSVCSSIYSKHSDLNRNIKTNEISIDIEFKISYIQCNLKHKVKNDIIKNKIRKR